MTTDNESQARNKPRWTRNLSAIGPALNGTVSRKSDIERLDEAWEKNMMDTERKKSDTELEWERISGIAPKEQRVNFRSSEAERETLAALARYHGISLTDVLHMLIAKAAREAGIDR